MFNNIKEDILKLKKERNAIILAHYYQPDEVQEIADFVGDSYYLSQKGKECSQEVIVFCGVEFMAESAKVLSPDKVVLFSNPKALCPMADMATKEEVLELKEKHPNAKVVCYINSSTEVKTVVDVCCTSSSAINIIENIDSDEIIFLPDRNLGSYIQEQVPDKKLILWDGYCHVHDRITAQDIIEAKEKYGQDIKVLAHPECRKEVRDLADYVGSTGGIINFATNDNGNKYLIVTEYGVVHELKKKNPTKDFYVLNMCCPNMKKTSLKDVYNCLTDLSNEVVIEEDVRKKAALSLERMHILGENKK